MSKPAPRVVLRPAQRNSDTQPSDASRNPNTRASYAQPNPNVRSAHNSFVAARRIEQQRQQQRNRRVFGGVMAIVGVSSLLTLGISSLKDLGDRLGSSTPATAPAPPAPTTPPSPGSLAPAAPSEANLPGYDRLDADLTNFSSTIEGRHIDVACADITDIPTKPGYVVDAYYQGPPEVMREPIIRVSQHICDDLEANMGLDYRTAGAVPDDRAAEYAAIVIGHETTHAEGTTQALSEAYANCGAVALYAQVTQYFQMDVAAQGANVAVDIRSMGMPTEYHALGC